ncbi:MAG: hypothetical protein WBQ11_24620 [Isosphaeraceae bacterium]
MAGSRRDQPPNLALQRTRPAAALSGHVTVALGGAISGSAPAKPAVCPREARGLPPRSPADIDDLTTTVRDVEN